MDSNPWRGKRGRKPASALSRVFAAASLAFISECETDNTFFKARSKFAYSPVSFLAEGFGFSAIVLEGTMAHPCLKINCTKNIPN